MSAESPAGPRSLAAKAIVRSACANDVPGVVTAVQELLLELGSKPPSAPELDATVRELIDDDRAGAVLVAVARSGTSASADLDSEDVVGVLAASWQLAIHATGHYATIQDLWVHRAWRNRELGARLIDALVELARARGIARIEVGLPREHFATVAATKAFYARHEFAPLGPRMRRVLT